MHVVLEHTRLGRYAFAIGSNRDRIVYAGIPVDFMSRRSMRSAARSRDSPA